MRKTTVIAIWLSIVFLFPAPVVYATTITADTTGTNNLTDADFYGVHFVSGAGFIESVIFDLSAYFNATAGYNAFFDFDGADNYGGINIPAIGSLTGLTPSDISWVMSSPLYGEPLWPSILRFNFAPGSFGAGDVFRFAADTDFLVQDIPTPGDVFGIAAIPLTIILDDGRWGTGTFAVVSDIRSELTIRSYVPEPAAMMLFGLGLIGLGALRRITGK